MNGEPFCHTVKGHTPLYESLSLPPPSSLPLSNNCMTIFYICSVPRSIATTEPAPHTQPSCPPYPFTEPLTFAPILRDLCALRDIPFHLRFSFAPNQKRRGRPPEATKPAKGQRGLFFTRAKNSTSLQLRLTGSSRRGYGGCDESASFISVSAFHLWSQQNSAHVWADNAKSDLKN